MGDLGELACTDWSVHYEPRSRWNGNDGEEPEGQRDARPDRRRRDAARTHRRTGGIDPEPCRCGRTLVRIGRIMGRSDDMLIIRGVNVYPSALANILHRFPEVNEYRIIVTREGPMDEIALQVECPSYLKSAIADEVHIALNLRVPVETVAVGTLPRFELKARRVEDRRNRA